MKIVQKIAAQGDITVIRIGALPAGLPPKSGEGGRLILAHSETGHHHYTSATGAEMYEGPADSLVCYLRVSGEYADIVHARPFDTHETLRLPTGVYRVRRGREYTPQGFRPVQD